MGWSTADTGWVSRSSARSPTPSRNPIGSLLGRRGLSPPVEVASMMPVIAAALVAGPLPARETDGSPCRLGVHGRGWSGGRDVHAAVQQGVLLGTAGDAVSRGRYRTFARTEAGDGGSCDRPRRPDPTTDAAFRAGPPARRVAARGIGPVWCGPSQGSHPGSPPCLPTTSCASAIPSLRLSGRRFHHAVPRRSARTVVRADEERLAVRSDRRAPAVRAPAPLAGIVGPSC